MPAPSKRDLAALRRLRANLDVTDPNFAGSARIREALSSATMRLYLESYVLPDIARLQRTTPGPIIGEAVPAMPVHCTCPMDVTDHLGTCPAFDSHHRSKPLPDFSAARKTGGTDGDIPE
jgi:hypothetical protein